MKEIKTMLLGIAIMLATIVIHLFIADQLFTDFIAILGICIVILGYYSLSELSKKSTRKGDFGIDYSFVVP